MAKSVGNLAVEFTMGMDASQFTNQSSVIVSAFGDIGQAAEAMGANSFAAANAGIGVVEGSVERLTAIIENTMAMQNQQTRNIGALFASQKKLARGGGRPANQQMAAMDRHRDIGARVLEARKPPGGDKTSLQLGSQLKSELATSEALYAKFKQIWQIREKALKAGDDIENGEKREKAAADKYHKSLLDIDRTKQRIKKTTDEEAEEQKRVTAGYHDAHVIMQQLGNKQSQNVLVQAQVAKNAERFKDAMDRARQSTLYTNAELEHMEEQFKRVNTEKNAAGQLKGSNQLGAALQQAAYGVEDFASQIERGIIPALGGAANNINMIVGQLGPPWLMAVSVGTIAGIQFAKSLGFIGQEAESGTEKLDRMKGYIESLSDSMQELRENARMKLEISFDPDIESVSGALDALVSQASESFDKFNVMQREAMLEARNAEKKAIEDRLNRTSFFQPMEKNLKDLRAIAELDRQIGLLGGNNSDEMQGQIDLIKKMKQEAEDLVEIEARRLKLTNDQLRLMQQGQTAPEDSRTHTESLKDAEDSAQRQMDLIKEIQSLQQQRQRLVEVGEKDFDKRIANMDRLKAINEEIATKQSEGAEEARKFTEASERNAEALETSRGAAESLEESIRALRLEAAGSNEMFMEAEETLKGWDEQLKEVQLGVNGVVKAQALYNRLVNASRESAQARIDAAMDAGEKEETLQFRIRDAMHDQNLAVNAANNLQDQIHQGLVSEKNVRAQILGHQDRAVKAAEAIAELRNEARSGLESETSALESRLGAIDKEYAKQKKIREEREKLNEAIKAGLATNLIDPQRAKEMMTAFDEVVKAEEQITDLEKELGRTSTMAGEVKAVTRDSTEAQSIILNAMREGQQRAEQEPIINQLIQVHQAIERQTQIMSKPQTEGSLRPAVLKK